MNKLLTLGGRKKEKERKRERERERERERKKDYLKNPEPMCVGTFLCMYVGTYVCR